MMNGEKDRFVHLIPISRIRVVNPRIRNKKTFKELVENIAALGLKKPITITRSADEVDISYDLVCGQGRMEAFVELGETEIPAFVIEADPEECMVKSLVENCARRQHRAIDLLQDIGGMKERGYSDGEIEKRRDYLRSMFAEWVDCLLKESNAFLGRSSLAIYQ